MRYSLALLLSIALVVGACSSGSTGESPGTPAGTPASTAAGSPAGTAAGTMNEPWRTATLLDVVTGDEFTINDLAGKVVAIESMAIWCANCRTQQLQAQAALATVASPDLVYISLDVDPNERPEDLAEYARRQGFDWRFVVASAEMSRSLAATFGDQVLSPPATPIVVLGRDGGVVEQHTGIKGASDLESLFRSQLR